MMLRIRLHGRGGEGVKLTGRIVSRAAFLAGHVVQDSPLYGAERRGAPVMAFARVADHAIEERGYVAEPDALVVMDDSLLGQADAGVLDGVGEATFVVVNSTRSEADLRGSLPPVQRLVVRDLTSIAMRAFGRPLLSAVLAALLLRLIGLGDAVALAAAVHIEMSEAGVPPAAIDANERLAHDIFESESPRFVPRSIAAPPPRTTGGFVVPRLSGLQARPAIEVGGAVKRRTDGWRVERPVIDLSRCTRCLLCFVSCPEGAIHLDADRWPSVAYEHCKGCLVCVSECRPAAIHVEPEVRA